MVHEQGGRTIPASATTNENNWGQTISAKSSEKNSGSTPWVAVSLPDDPSLAGKAVTCDIALDVAFPEATGSSNFQTVSRKMGRQVTMQLAQTPGAGASYNDWWWEGTVGGLVLLLACALALVGTARGLQRKAHPTRLLSPPPSPTPGVPAAV
jgi:hypothetical protein